MRFKRDEGFRFSFGTPLPVFFTIDEMNGMVGTSEGEAKLIDLSPNGMKLNIPFDILMSNREDVKITVRFKLSQLEHCIKGKVMWKKNAINSFFYGIHFLMDELEREEMIRDLKEFAKRQYSKNNSPY
ncbi:PilZ domain-containing protein [Cytobacillus massiliigabonensis]|uniref:PilZ domain-containing protein n=1 Tax=Cytobacillus massiliigabonensis TaxID=1871011 RepID=UPI000C85FFC3|nr:PilZ domain-containing protein [Cytobacillus massiliigabonensis]